MAIELKQSLKLSQQLVMTPQLQQAIKLLQLNRLELAEHCMSEMMENPMLEEQVEEAETDRSAETKEAEPADANPKELDPQQEQGQVTNDIDWENYLNSRGTQGQAEKVGKDYNPDQPSFEANLTRDSTLAEYLLGQLHLSKMIPNDRKVGELIIGNLDENGYLRSTCEEMALKNNIDVEDVEAVLGRIQEFDPIGVGARDLKECLFIQSKQIPNNELVRKIIVNHLGDVEKRNYTAICKSTKASKAQVSEAMKLIGNLEPKPGRQFYDESSNYITPDIYVYKVNGDYVIVQNEDGLPKLRISSVYENAIRGGDVSSGAKEYINEKLRSAVWLIRSIHQRQRTIYKVTESIVKMQREFLESGIASLKPMVLRDVAADIGMHESTVSRVTTNKYVHTPQGIFELKYFFNSGIKRVHGVSVASEAVKERIRALITAENSKKPFSDQDIVELLRKNNIDIARRTVAKYREMLGILSSSKRKQVL